MEWLAEERYGQPAYKNVDWIDPSSFSSFNTTNSNSNNENEDNDNAFVIPIYPIPALYLPYGNHTLNNVEPRNLKMALDLNCTTDKLFCVTMVAADSGRISRFGTLLRINELEPTYDPYDNTTLIRITVYCQSEGIVEICDIQNPEAASRKQRLLKSPEYLKGRVVRRNDSLGTSSSFSKEVISKMIQNFNLIKTMYKMGICSKEMPLNSLTNLASAMPSWTESELLESNIWKVAQIWQSVCLTIQEGRQQLLNSDRNEFMVAAASKKSGPLKLPIHMEDLEPQDRQYLQELEVRAQREFWELKMDPCLDFLAMMSLDTDEERISWLSHLISRERERLDIAAKQFTPVKIEKKEEQSRKGAWFNDDLWED